MTPREYPTRPLVGIGIAVIKANHILLIRRGRAPALGAWSLPGGAQRLGETAHAAARRELAEETSLTVGTLHLAGYLDSMHHDADGRLQYHYTILDFCAAWTHGTPQAGSDAQAILWADINALAPYDLPPETHTIIQTSQTILARSWEGIV